MHLKTLIVFIAVILAVTHAASIISHGEEYDCNCTREYTPICASNGVTYANACSFHCAKVEILDLETLYDGECEEESEELDDEYWAEAPTHNKV